MDESGGARQADGVEALGERLGFWRCLRKSAETR